MRITRDDCSILCFLSEIYHPLLHFGFPVWNISPIFRILAISQIQGILNFGGHFDHVKNKFAAFHFTRLTIPNAKWVGVHFRLGQIEEREQGSSSHLTTLQHFGSSSHLTTLKHGLAGVWQAGVDVFNLERQCPKVCGKGWRVRSSICQWRFGCWLFKRGSAAMFVCSESSCTDLRLMMLINLVLHHQTSFDSPTITCVVGPSGILWWKETAASQRCFWVTQRTFLKNT